MKYRDLLDLYSRVLAYFELVEVPAGVVPEFLRRWRHVGLVMREELGIDSPVYDDWQVGPKTLVAIEELKGWIKEQGLTVF